MLFGREFSLPICLLICCISFVSGAWQLKRYLLCRYVKGRRLHDPQDITSIKLDDILKVVLKTDTFKVSEFSVVLESQLEVAPSLPVQMKHRLSLSSTELKPTVVDVTVSVASERALPIRDFGENFKKVDLKLQEMMQQVFGHPTCTCMLRANL